MASSSCFASRRDGSINRARKKVRRSKRSSLRKCAPPARRWFRFWKASNRPLSQGELYSPANNKFARPRSINYCLFLIPLFQSRPRYPLPEKSPLVPPARTRLQERHEILDLVGLSLHSRRILHAPFVALWRTIHGTIALIFLSPRDLFRATAIAEAGSHASQSLIPKNSVQSHSISRTTD